MLSVADFSTMSMHCNLIKSANITVSNSFLKTCCIKNAEESLFCFNYQRVWIVNVIWIRWKVASYIDKYLVIFIDINALLRKILLYILIYTHVRNLKMYDVKSCWFFVYNV